MASAPPLANQPGFTFARLEERSRAAGEDDRAIAVRLAAAAQLDPLVLPDRARHLWRYTDPVSFVPRSDPTVQGPQPVAANWQIDAPHAGAALIAGGALRGVELGHAARSAGVEIVDLHTAKERRELGTLVPPAHGFVEMLNAAAWAGGVCVRIPEGVRLVEPIALRLLAGGGGSVQIPRVLVVVGRGSDVEVVEVHMDGEGGHVFAVSELLVAADARVRYGLVQRWDPRVTGHLTVRARLADRAHLQTSFASLGGSVCKVDLGTVLAGEGAEVETFGVAIASNMQHFDHHTEHVHEARHTRSKLDFRVTATDAARSVYTGLIRIARHAEDSEAYQENRNLLLSGTARADTIPELEILTDDVRCSHGATVAPLDPEQVFYLSSRGLSRHQAERLIVYGFLDQTIQRLPVATRERIEALIAAKLHEETV